MSETRLPASVPPSRMVTAGLALAATGMLLAVADLVLDTTYGAQVLAQVNADTFFYVPLAMRVVVYIGAIAGTVALSVRTRRGSQRARKALAWLMFAYLLGCFVNFVITDFTTVLSLFGSLLMHADTGAETIDSLEPLFFASIIGDGALALLALTVAILLLVGGRTRNTARQKK